VRRPPPRLDEHGDAIRRLGWAAFADADPETRGVTGVSRPA
jgi:hypothetical protein